MPMRYDTTLKTLFQAPPPQLLQLLVGGQAHTMLTVEYPTVQMRRPDLVVRLTDGRLYHLELQSANDPAMPWRMLVLCTAPERKMNGMVAVATSARNAERTL